MTARRAPHTAPKRNARASSRLLSGKKRLPTVVGHTIIILFCVWHMATVAIYSIPTDGNGIAQTVRFKLLPIIRPYILTLSQWQQWNLFSPNPLRRVTTFHLDVQQGTTWVPLKSFDPRQESAWNKDTYMLKALITFDSNDELYNSSLLALMRSYCISDLIPQGTTLRMRRDYYIVPHDKEPVSEWLKGPPASESKPDLLTRCP